MGNQQNKASEITDSGEFLGKPIRKLFVLLKLCLERCLTLLKIGLSSALLKVKENINVLARQPAVC